jgi:acyl dehydratase
MKRLVGLALVVAVMATLTGGTALAVAKESDGDASSVPGQDYFTLVGTIQEVSTESGIVTIDVVITVLLHNGNRFVKPVEEGDTQTVYTTAETVYNAIGLVRGETVSIHGSVDTEGVFWASRVTGGVPCPACPVLPEE